MIRAMDVYLLNPEFMKNILKFSELTCILVLTLNNKKYNKNLNLNGVDLLSFVEDFHEHIDSSDTTMISILPSPVIKNVLQVALLCRKYNAEILCNDMLCTRLFIYFSLIYSSQIELIVNPHLRSEIFDIMIYFFIVHTGERFAKPGKIFNFSFEYFEIPW
jgi:hypothetical protein